jgi:hypothetical protein
MADLPHLNLTAPSLFAICWAVVLWCCAFGGSLTRIHRTVPFWKPMALGFSAFNASWMVALFYLVFHFGPDLRALALPRWAEIAATPAVFVLLILIGLWVNKAFPGLEILRKRVVADADKDSAGDRYPGKPLDFTVNSAF